MKRLLLLISLLFMFSSLFCQESNQNYIATRTMLDRLGTKYLDNIQYYDGLGRPFMNVQKGVTPAKANLITLQEYDGFGRESKSWLPHVSTSAYLVPVSFKSEVPRTYGGDSRPYAETVYEHSPLNRVLQQYGPGASWSQHPVATSNLTNTESGELSCIYYSVTSTGGLTRSNNYGKGELYVVKTTDEDGKVSYIFTDKLGRKVLSRQMLGSDAHDTYYVYDDFGNLCFVLPPSYQVTASLSLYAYQYKYDDWNRCIEKKFPGCASIKYVYDKADNLIFSQDGVQRVNGEWTFYLYDKLHRLVLKGVCMNTNTSQVGSLLVTASLSRNSTTGMILSEGIDKRGYASSFEIVSPTVHSVNYYDDYTFLNLKGFSGKEGGSVNARGLLTGNVTYLLDGSSAYCTVTHYDPKGRIAKVISDNDMKGTETTTTTYTFTGKPLTVEHVHTGKDLFLSLKHTELYRYAYDHAERLTKVTHQLDANSPVVLSGNTYDELGRLQSKTFHDDPYLTTTYRYNIRDWLESIAGDFFKQILYYDYGINAAFPRYNGNICRADWRLDNSSWQSYDFFYDGLNRLTSANYTGPSSSLIGKPDFSEKVLEYDRMGNIRRLQRHGKGKLSTLVDDLTFSYVSNRLTNISDVASDPLSAGTFNYSDLNKYNKTGLSDFKYDVNGNLIQDLDKEITSISYNSLNLPENISFSDNGNPREISYNYDANGVKRSVTHVTGPTFVVTPMASLPSQGGIINYPKRYLNTTVYCDNIIYERVVANDGHTITLPKTELDRILTEEGYITLNGTTPVYHYFIKDYLGNVRVVMNEDGGTVEQSNNYYPFGGTFDSTGDSEQPYKFCGKEFDPMHGLNWSDSGARHLRSDAPGFMGIDPLCEKYYSVSPYAYCMNNPVNAIDPDGRSTWVINSGNNNYRVIGGDLGDKDKNIYVYSIQDGNLVRGISIGITSSTTSFYNSDVNAWATGSIINPSDKSADNFLGGLFSCNPPMFDDYMANAGNGGKYDFKVTNGTDKSIEKIDIYRGMPIGQTGDGQTIYTSARDVGNIAAGYVAGANGMPWNASRAAFDTFQSKTSGRLTMEGISTRNAEYYGWKIGNNINQFQKAGNFNNSINSILRKLWNKITK